MGSEFCKKCGAHLSTSNNFCSKCGTQRISENNTRQLKPIGFSKKTKVGMGIVLVVVAFFILVGVSGSLNQQQNVQEKSVSSNTIQIGEPVIISGISYNVKSVDARTFVAGESVGEHSDARFILIQLEVKNVSKESKSELKTSDFVLMDSEDHKFDARQYSAMLYSETWGVLQPGLGGERGLIFLVAFDKELQYNLLFPNNIVIQLGTIRDIG